MRLTRRPGFEMPLSRLRDQLEQIFEQPDFAVSDLLGGWLPPVDVLEDNERMTVKVELPGFKREDLDISVQENNLMISGHRRADEQKKDGEFRRSERFYGRFHRAITLPSSVDTTKIDARYKEGILTITLPKSEKAKAKQIEVKVE